MLEITKVLFSSLARPTAYLDPGSGSFLIQILIASALGAFVAFRGYFAKLWGMMTGKKKDETKEDDDE